ncbi:UDP-N-acetylmuramoyl-tripeptide--D-alanyl-D-alanine ligase [Nocardioides acrostichi]|uniref:UDP-N-acetylmuramoyl-tripeptide--D-alanyl-D-alanine ligase n=1 Tax=Nocardioides acrostichi TaxID=2784339 RepID=A0A930Y602_9ACTN|nr:UDP-N-acetylmuramoyl-tripeptide--D-alanyl-D-alanine ligase [Nocardioides acrostichi]MBF4160417.1 UDP-N-acetylmuramoyl-tripeptide--D-alanyl-D-alanine ligase [Nocardioides acrostichi]
MIALSLARIAEIVGGEVVGPPGSDDVVVDAPAVIDGRKADPGGLFVAFVGEHTDGHDFAAQAGEAGAVAVLGSRPTELPTVVVDDAREALQTLASFVVARVREAGGLTVFGITGSSGKTSTKDLLGAVLAHAAPTVATHGSFNNELGMPLTALRVEQATRYLVLELGARGIGHIAELTDIVRPDVSLVLNVGQAHLGEFGSREAIAQAKGELVEALPEDGTAVLNAGDDRVMGMARRTRAQVTTFGTDGVAEVRVEELSLDRLGRPSFTLATPRGSVPVTLQLVGAHQALNAAAACAAALAVGLTPEQVAEALAAITTLSQWRMELHELPSGVIVLNDAYNANPDSMRAGLDALVTLGADGAVQRTVAVLGEMRELGPTGEAEHREVGRYALARGVDVVLAVGEAARGIADGAEDAAVVVHDNDEATAWLAEHVQAGDAVLFKASNGTRLYEVASTIR